ncbi:MAG TPA: toll/interleukin-1 receptor domain-containing protein [Vicinamibacterales bacterium]|nr:toll/interleukin-1 receptor domain-containing protein [Vicinamibacterales bacterium]
MALIFISYRRDDSAGYSGRLHEELENRLGSGQVFRDVEALRPGQDFVEAIDARLRECRACVAMIGRTWLDARDETGRRRLDQPDDYVRLEIAAALDRPGVLVVPALVGGARMPDAQDLPASIQALGRRQAITIRDETWESDVDRLANIIAQHCGVGTIAGPGAQRTSGRSKFVGLGVAALAVAILAIVLGRDAGPNGSDGADPAQRVNGAPPPAPSGSPVESGAPAGTSPVTASGYAIAIPRNAEVSHEDLVYTLLAGSVVPHGASRTLWLRFRVANNGSGNYNLWDQSFRLAVGGDLIPASGGLNEISTNQSVRQVVVRFELPPDGNRATLRVSLRGDVSAEIPLDLASTRQPPRHDTPVNGDALSNADIVTVVREPTPLLNAGDMKVTLMRVTARRFVNKTRIVLSLRAENTAGYARGLGDVTLRVVDGADVLAPVSNPYVIVQGNATASNEVIFDVSPASRMVVLRASFGQTNREIGLTVR